MVDFDNSVLKRNTHVTRLPDDQKQYNYGFFFLFTAAYTIVVECSPSPIPPPHPLPTTLHPGNSEQQFCYEQRYKVSLFRIMVLKCLLKLLLYLSHSQTGKS